MVGSKNSPFGSGAPLEGGRAVERENHYGHFLNHLGSGVLSKGYWQHVDPQCMVRTYHLAGTEFFHLSLKLLVGSQTLQHAGLFRQLCDCQLYNHQDGTRSSSLHRISTCGFMHDLPHWKQPGLHNCAGNAMSKLHICPGEWHLNPAIGEVWQDIDLFASAKSIHYQVWSSLYWPMTSSQLYALLPSPLI